jgi:spore germination protein KB
MKMKSGEQIEAFQMSFLFFTFTTGATIVNIPGPLISYAKNGAWLSLLLSLAVGMALLSCILFLYRKYPGLTFIEYSRATIGNWLTALLAVPFILFQFHMAGGMVLEIGLFMTSSMMRQTPLYVYPLSIFFVVALTVRSGMETMARMFVVPMLFAIFFIGLTVGLSAANYEPENLFPIMPDGIKPVLLGAYYSYGIPYVGIIPFSMLLPYVRQDQQKLLHIGMYTALLLNGLCLISATLSTILVFGPMAGERKYSMFEVARTVDLLEVIQRIESVIGFSLIATSFMKASIMLYILNLTFTHLFKLRDDRLLIFPLALACFLFSMIFIEREGAAWANVLMVLFPLEASAAYLLPLIVVTAVSMVKKKLRQHT